MRPTTHLRPTTVLLLLACACAGGGCAQFGIPRIDTSGERIFAPAPPQPQPDGLRSWDNVDLILSPHETIAPVGGEVVLVAGVLGPDHFLSTNERVEWTMDPGGVGEVVEVGQGTWLDLLLLDFNRPRKLSAASAVGSTSRNNLRLTLGTPGTADDVCVRSGETWMAVSSPLEGTSYVTAYAPSVYGWDRRRRTAVIHWVDAQYVFPPPAINPAGTRHQFTTTVTRQTDGSPCAGWLVRYEIAGGPPAGFAPDGSQAVEVQTDQLGQATVEIFQQQPVAGTNTVTIQVIRPAGANGGGKRLVVRTGSTLKTWTIATPTPAVGLRVTGPQQVAVGDKVRFEIQVTNTSGAPLSGLVIKDTFESGLVHDVASGAIERPLDDLAPGQCQRIHVTFRAAQPGRLCHTVEVHGPQGTLAAQRACVNALGLAVTPQPYLLPGAKTQPGPQPKIQPKPQPKPQAKPQPKPQPKPEVKPAPAARPSVSVRMTGPAKATVGESAILDVELTNTGTRPLTAVRASVSLGPELKPVQATRGFYEDKARGVLAITIDAIAPGKRELLQVQAICQAAGKGTGRVAVTTAQGATGQAEAAIEIGPAPKPAAKAGKPAAPALGPPDLSMHVVETSDPVEAGKSMAYRVTVTNRGQTADANVVLEATVPPQMIPNPLNVGGPARFDIEGQTVRFKPVARFLPGESRTYEIGVVAKTPGSGRFTARLSSATLQQAKVIEESTQVNPKP